MEGKTVILSVFIMSLAMAQIQVEALVCCHSLEAYAAFHKCIRDHSGSVRYCVSIINGCEIRIGIKMCPLLLKHDILENSGGSVNEYCKLGCASSVCGAMVTLQDSDASEIVNEAVEGCAKACSAFCTKGSMTAIETA